MTKDKKSKNKKIEVKINSGEIVSLQLPNKCNSKDAEYILDVIHLMMKHQYGID